MTTIIRSTRSQVSPSRIWMKITTSTDSTARIWDGLKTTLSGIMQDEELASLPRPALCSGSLSPLRASNNSNHSRPLSSLYPSSRSSHKLFPMRNSSTSSTMDAHEAWRTFQSTSYRRAIPALVGRREVRTRRRFRKVSRQNRTHGDADELTFLNWTTNI
jgi:hypothetical protein